MTKTQDDIMRQRIATFNRESLPSEEAVRQGTKDLEQRFSEELLRRREERKEIDESMRKIYAPLAAIVNKDKDAVEEKQRLRDKLAQRAKQQKKLTLPKIPPVRPMIASGSISTWVTPPYDHVWSWIDPNNTCWADGGAEGGTINGSVESGSGAGHGYRHGQTAGGLGTSFHPIREFELLRVVAFLFWSASWFEDSNLDPAHVNGFSEIVIYQYDLNWNFQGVALASSTPLFTDGTSWYETHSGGTSGIGADAFVPVSSNNNYIVWVIAGCEADAYGSDPIPVPGDTSSIASCQFNAVLANVILEQIF